MEHKLISLGLGVAAMAILLLSLVNPKGVGAQYYAPGQVIKAISVDKKVRSLNDLNYFDNISSNQKVFFKGDTVEFKISVENTGKETLNNINVKDTLPIGLSLIFFPGTFNNTDNSVSWTVDSLDPAQTKSYLIRAKISEIKTNLGQTYKVTNNSSVKVDNINDSDNASFFVGIGTIPKTGDGTLPLKTILVVLSAGSALYLRKLARGY